MPGGPVPLLAFQSRVGPIEWLGPEVVAETKRLGAAGCRRLHVQPVSFTCEHIETLHELDIELVEDAAGAGVTEFSRGAALNLDAGWLAGLGALLHDRAFTAEEAADV
jgi:ferrochelatase